MADLKNITSMKDDFDPFAFECDSCGKTKVYTDEEIEKVKKTHPNPKEYTYDFFISCPFCKTGYMEPPSFFSFFGGFEDLNEK